MRLRRCRTSPIGAPRAEAWYDTDRGARLTDAEAAALARYADTWVGTFEDGSTADELVTFSAAGFLNAAERETEATNAAEGQSLNVYPTSTSLRAAKFMLDHRHGSPLVAVRGPRGELPLVVRVRLTSAGVTTEVPHSWIEDEVEDARESMGSHCCSDETLSDWTYQFGALRHLEELRRAAGDSKWWVLSKGERQRASRISSRCALAVLAQFRSLFPVDRDVWLRAAHDTGVAVEVWSSADPTWRAVGPEGAPVT